MNDSVGTNDLSVQMRSLSVFNMWISRMIYAAAKLGIADSIQEGPRSSDELAASLGVHAGALYRMLRALSGAGVFTELPERRFALAPLGATLRTGAPGSMRDFVLLFGGDVYARAWLDLLSSVQSGKTAVEHVFGAPLYPYLAGHPEDAELFDKAMTSFTHVDTAAAAARYDFSAFRTVVDVGGGHGSLLVAVLERNPELRGILFDQPHILEGARARVGASAVAARCEVVAGDFFEAVPSADVHMLKHIVCNWDDDAAIRILKRCHRALPPGGRVLVIESVIGFSAPAELLDVHLLAVVGGRMRTEQEHRDLLAAAGFRLTRLLPTDVGLEHVVVEGVREP
ncbi:methyltransferase [Polyangium sp. 15x6]|uniref:methyltransferase n=1 Tax=Polyangium sp. 15x6 TaxID=3042687 RepID=UPI00249C2610|nr:methyltransferase [Polyangium sp. 15x6]MDI3283917.1 methyltransferase [Polyangium sp. 15x6]